VEVIYIRIVRGVGTFYGMVFPDIGAVALYEEGCYQRAPIVIETTMEALLEIHGEMISGEEITEEEWIDFMQDHTRLVIDNRPTEEDIP
jgi:hypothetical protein